MAKRWVVGGIWAVLMTTGLLTCGGDAAAEKPRAPKKVHISDVIIEGNRRMTTEKIKALLHTQPGKEFKEDIVDDDVRELYKTCRFSNIQTYLQEDGAGKVKIYFAVREIPNKVQRVTYLGAKHVKEDELRNITGVMPGMTLNPNRNREGCQSILAKYEEMGRPFTQCTLVKGGDLGDREVVYQITEGPKIKVCDIQFVGNTFVSGARLATQLQSLKEWFRLRNGTYHKQTAEAGKADIEKYYRQFGYQDVQVSLETKRSADGREATLIYHIQEGPRYRIQDVPDVRGTKSVPLKQLKALSVFKPGDYLDERKLQKDIKSITDYLGGHGKAVQVQAVPVWITDQPGWTGVRYEIEEIHFRIGTIRVTGNERISGESILAHVPLVPGSILFHADLQQAEQNLAELGLFVVDEATGVRPTITVVDGDGYDRKDLLITVKEKTKAKVNRIHGPR